MGPEGRAGGDPAGYEADGPTVAWRAFHEEATRRLAAAGIEDPALEARRIVEEASGYEGAEFHLGLVEPATKRGVIAFDRMVERRLGGEPLQYVLGRWAFRSLDLMVDRRVLIPRPETEIIAGRALDELERMGRDDGVLVVVDLGTGTGAIGLSLATERADTEVTLTDVSVEALEVARANLAGIGRAATRVTIREGPWFDALDTAIAGKVHLIVANPPYVADVATLPSSVSDWEPIAALVAADQGIADLDHIISGAGAWLRPGGALVLEMAPDQTAWAVERARSQGFTEVDVIIDLTGSRRGVCARWPK